MACNCQKGGKAQEYVYTSPTGEKKTYRTEIEAQAARIRNKGGSYQTVTK